MRDIDLQEFGTPDDFVDLHDKVKLHVEQDSSWDAEITKVANMAPGTSTTVHGAPDKGLDNSTIVKF
jgi:hypothetical protein